MNIEDIKKVQQMILQALKRMSGAGVADYIDMHELRETGAPPPGRDRLFAENQLLKYKTPDDEVHVLATLDQVKKKILIPISALTIGPASPTFTEPGYAFTIGEYGLFSFAPPNDWDSTTDITIVIHWNINEAYATGSGEVQWLIDYRCTPDDATESTDSPTHYGAIHSGDINIPATAKYLTKTEMAIPAANIAINDVIVVWVDRENINDGTDPTAEPVVICIQIEYTANKLGTAV